MRANVNARTRKSADTHRMDAVLTVLAALVTGYTALILVQYLFGLLLFVGAKSNVQVQVIADSNRLLSGDSADDASSLLPQHQCLHLQDVVYLCLSHLALDARSIALGRICVGLLVLVDVVTSR